MEQNIPTQIQQILHGPGQRKAAQADWDRTGLRIHFNIFFRSFICWALCFI
jgi:hypothetical protein